MAGGKLHVSTSPVSRIVLSAAGHLSASEQGAAEGAAFDLGKIDAAYVRLTITDANGRNAWSNIVWLDDLA